MTVAELRERMSVTELVAWSRYVEEMGPLNLAWRIDYAVARSAAPFIGGGSDTLRKLMPWPTQAEQQATPEDLLQILQGARTK